MELGGIVALLRPKARKCWSLSLSQSAVLSQDGAQERKVDALGEWRAVSHML